MKKLNWYDPQKHTGWRKTQSADTRRKKLMESTDKRFTLRNRNILAGRRAQALSNVQQDKETKVLSKRDAQYFFRVAKKRVDLEK